MISRHNTFDNELIIAVVNWKERLWLISMILTGKVGFVVRFKTVEQKEAYLDKCKETNYVSES